MKSHLEIRPTFVWTEKRIKGHIAMCFISYTFLNKIRLTMQWNEHKVFKTLNKMQVSLVKQKNNQTQIYLRSAINEDIESLINKMKLSKHNDTVPFNLISNYL
jgi:transposase